MSTRINLCRNCFKPLTKPLSTYAQVYGFSHTGHVCGPACKRYWRNASIEERKCVHFSWLRLETEANQIDLPFPQAE